MTFRTLSVGFGAIVLKYSLKTHNLLDRLLPHPQSGAHRRHCAEQVGRSSCLPGSHPGDGGECFSVLTGTLWMSTGPSQPRPPGNICRLCFYSKSMETCLSTLGKCFFGQRK